MILDFDDKEKQLLDFYCNRIVNRDFDEHDVFSFYILIRSHLEKSEKYDKNNKHGNYKYKWIGEFGHLIAHRERDQGAIYDNIMSALNNGYQTIAGSKKILGYNGIADGELENELSNLFGELGHTVTPQIIDEVILCTFSILQYAKYVNRASNIIGEVRLFQHKSGLGLYTVGNIKNGHEPWVCMAKLNGHFMEREFSAGYIDKPVEVVRSNGRLAIKYDGNII